LDPIVFCQSGHVALAAALVRTAAGARGPLSTLLLVLALIHHGFMFLLFLRVYTFSVPGSRFAPWFPLANLVVDVILIRAIYMCLTGKVTWRGTDYRDAARS